MDIKKVSNIVINITLQDNSWNCVDEINIVFGEIILIIGNSSYKEGFSNGREELTTVIEVLKNPNINPCVICEDVCNLLGSTNISSEADIQLVLVEIQKAIEVCNIYE